MVAVVAGSGLGLLNVSSNLLGSIGVLGQSLLGQGSRAYVNAATGNLVLQGLDQTLSGRGADVLLLRTYNSKGTLTANNNGLGWSWDGENTVAFSGSAGQQNLSGTVTRTTGDGHVVTYAFVSSSVGYASSEGDGATDTIKFDSGRNQWVWTDGSTRTQEFYDPSVGNNVGRLQSRIDPSGNRLDFGYSGALLTQITDFGSGQQIRLVYSGSPQLLSEVDTYELKVDGNGKVLEPPTVDTSTPVRRVLYAYTNVGGVNRLQSVKTDLTPGNTADASFFVTAYGYDSSGRITSVTQNDGSTSGGTPLVVSFTYDTIGRVKTVSDANGLQTFNYNGNSTDIVISDAQGNNAQTWTYSFDNNQQLTQVQSPAPVAGGSRLSTQFFYDANGNVTKITDSLGKSVIYQYDAHNNWIVQRDQLGNTVARTYDANDQLVSETHYTTPDTAGLDELTLGVGNAGGELTTHYVYDGNSRLRFTISPEGRVVENRYDIATGGSGLLASTRQYTADRYLVASYGESDLAAWASSLADKTQQQLTEYSYDFRGNLSATKSYASVDANGSGVLGTTGTLTQYIYDGHGELLHSIVLHGANRDQGLQTSYVYDTLGRELARTDAFGTQTTSYNDQTGAITVTTQAGQQVVSTFNGVGQLTSVTRTDLALGSAAARATQYFYDPQGRLQLTVDAQGGRLFSFYDAAGRLSAQVDSTGHVTDYTYDGDGRVLTQTRYANTVGSTSSWVSVDGTGKVSAVTKHLFTVAPSASTGVDLVTAPTQDRTTTFHYDDAGRLDRTTDALGTVTNTSYDGLSRVTAAQTGGRVTRYFYDGDGRVVGTLDPLGFLTENRYDAAGRLTQTLRYATRSPQAADVAAPVWIGVADQTVASLKPFSVRLPAFDADGDPLKDGFSVVGTLPSWLTMTPDDGGVTLSGTPPAGFTSYPVTLRAADGRGGQTDVTLNIVVADTPPVWNGAVPDAVVSVNTSGFNLVLPQASDNEGGTLTYSITSALPPGLSFVASSRTISGTPTTPGLYTITARATDAQGLYSDTNFVLQVAGVAPAWTTAVAPQQAFLNQAYSFVVPAATDPGGTLTYSIVSAPSWLQLNPVTRTLTGTPPAFAAPQSVILQALDPVTGESVRLSFTIEVPNRPVTWTAFTPPAVVAGTSYSYQPPAAVDPDGTSLRYVVVQGSLPPGWTIDPATGRIQGSTNYQAIGNYTVTLGVRDNNGTGSYTQANRTVTFSVLNALPVYTGSGYSDVTIQAVKGAVINYSFSKSLDFSDPDGGALAFSFIKPSSLTATISGTTVTFKGSTGNTNSTSTITIIATDAFGAQVSRSFNLIIQAGGTISNFAPVSGGAGLTVTPADPLAGLRPSDVTALSSYVYYDAEGRVTGSVDAQGFLTETVYDEQANAQQTIRYLQALTVGASDTLATLRTQALNTTLAIKSETSSSSFDGFGRVVSSTNASGTITTFEYDSAGRLTRQVSAAGTSEQRAVRTRYDGFGEVTGVVGGEGEAALLAAHPTPTQSDIDAAIATRGTRYVYDNLGRRTQTIDANGRATLYYYDSEGRLTHAVNAAGEVSETRYNAFGQASSVIAYGARLDATLLGQLTSGTKGRADLVTALAALPTAANEVTTYDYDQRGSVTTVTDALGLQTTSTYDAFGELATQQRTIKAAQGPNAAVTTTTRFDYDADGRLASTTGDVSALNFNTQLRYDAFGRVVQSVDGAGKATVTRYDNNGRTVVVTDPLGRATTTAYDALGRALTVTDALGQVTSFAYDDVARTTSLTTPEGVQVVTSLNRFGQTISVRDGRGNITSYAYNKDGQLTTTTDALGRVVATNAYDASGRLASVTDARGIVATYSYDAVNRVVLRVVDPTVTGHTGLDLASAYQFDALGRQITVTLGKGDLSVAANVASVTSYQYDLDNRQTRVVVDPNGLALATTYAYDGLNDVTQVSQGTVASPNQYVTNYVFDKLGRRVQEIVAPSSVFGAGSAANRNLTTQYRYDAAGRVSRKIDANGNSVWYVYDAAGELRQTINALGEVGESTYDAAGRVVQTRQYLIRLSAATVAGFGDVVGLQTPTIDPNDRRSYLVYNDDGQLRFTITAQFKVYPGVPTVPRNWSISENRYDASGNVVETRQYNKFIDETRLEAIDTTSSPGITESEVTTELATLGYTNVDSTLVNIRRTRFAYDADNRLRFTVDAEGGVSENVYDNAGEVITTVRYAAAPTLSAFDEASINAAVNRSDAANQVTHLAYDSAGRLRYTVRELAADKKLVSELVYDALGRVVQSVAYANVLDATATDYSESGVAAKIAAGSADRRTVSVYDAAGHQVYTLRALADAQGNTRYLVAGKVYDPLGHVLSTTAYARDIAVPSDFRKTTIDAAVTADANDRTTRFVYDEAWRPRFTIAPDGTLGETVYDALGQVLETRQFDLKVDLTLTPLTVNALLNRRAARQVGDGITRGQKFSYDRAGRLLTTKDAAGFTETNAYDGLGNRISFTDKNGATWTWTYYRDGKVREAVQPAALLQLSNQTAPSVHGEIRTYFGYDALGNLTVTEEAHQTVDVRHTFYQYDRVGRLIQTELPGYFDPTVGQVVAALPDPSHGAFLRRLVNQYDALGNLVRTGVRTGLSTFLYEYKTYDNLGRVVHDVDPLGDVTRFDYTTFGEQKTVTRFSKSIGTTPAGSDGRWSADEVTSALGTDQFARTVTTTYDNLGRKTRVTQQNVDSYASYSVTGGVSTYSAAAFVSYTYNAFGDLVKESSSRDIDPVNGAVSGDTYHYYDVLGREIRSIDALGLHTARSYDNFGNVKEVIEYATAGAAGGITAVPPATPAESSKDRITDFAYDALNRLTDTIRKNVSYVSLVGGNYVVQGGTRAASLNVEHRTYDGLGHVTTSTDALGNVTTNVYNAVGDLTQVTEPARVTASGQIDPFHSQTSVNPVTSFTYNAFGQIVKTQRSAGGATLTTSAAYDIGGNAISSTDANGNVTSSRYDFAGRVIAQTQSTNIAAADLELAAGSSAAAGYSQTIERRFAYDAIGRQTAAVQVYTADGLAEKQQTGQRSVYNAFGEVVENRVISGAASAAVDSLTGPIVSRYVYDNAGHVITKTAGDGVTSYRYNQAGQVIWTRQTDPSGVESDRNSFVVYDRLGRATQQVLPFNGDDAVFQDSSVTSAAPLIEQGYDRWGDVVSVTQGAMVLSRATGISIDRSTQATTTYEYDHNGQQVAVHLPTTGGFVDSSSAQLTFPHLLNVTHATRRDAAGRAVQELDWQDDLTAGGPTKLLRVRSKEYDAAGQTTRDIDSTSFFVLGDGTIVDQGHVTRYAYDGFGRKVGTLNALGTVFVDQFDNNGNLLTHSVLRKTDGSAYNSNVDTVTPVAVQINRYKYDQANRRIFEADLTNDSLQSNKQYVTLTQYDERGLVRQQRQAVKLNGGTVSDGTVTTGYTYDALGNRTLQRDANGNTLNWDYEQTADFTVGRLKDSFTKDTANNVRTTTYTYTGFGQLKQQTTGDNARVYTYWNNGLLRQLTTSGTRFTTENTQFNTSETDAYDAFGRIRVQASTSSITGLTSGRQYTNESRTTRTSYDVLGRTTRVDVTGASTNLLSDVSYTYDGLNNRRLVTSDYIDPTTNASTFVSKGYTYDAEGRLLVADGAVNGLTITGGTTLTYDGLGRRVTSTTGFGGGGGSSSETDDNGPNGTLLTTTFTWSDSRRTDAYVYNDLSYLTRTDQTVEVTNLVQRNNNTVVSSQSLVNLGTVITDVRGYDDSGHLKSDVQEGPADIFQDHQSLFAVSGAARSTTNTYDDLGNQSRVVTVDQDQATTTDISYGRDLAGNVSSYAGTVRKTSDGTTITSPFASYTYSLEGGGLKVRSILSSGSPREDNYYDDNGNLFVRTGGTSDGNSFAQVFGYDANQQLILKQEQVRNSSGTFVRGGVQQYYYADGHEVAVIGNGTLKITQIDSTFTPISQAYPGSAPSTYQVTANDTLQSIAQSVFGDASLWYVIATANNIEFGPTDTLPSTEWGKTYRVPNVVIDGNNTSGTFRPYNPADALGIRPSSPTPAPVPPPSPGNCPEVAGNLGLIVSIAAAAAVTYFTAGVGSPVLAAALGGAAGDAAGQATRIGLNGESWDHFNLEEVAQAGIQSAAAAEIGGLIKGTSLVDRIARSAAQYGAHAVIGQAFGNPNAGVSLGGFLANATGAALDPYFAQLDTENFKFGSQGLERIVVDALSPQGFVWSSDSRNWNSILTEAIGVAGQVVVGGVRNIAEQRRLENRLRTANIVTESPYETPTSFSDALQDQYPGARLADDRASYSSNEGKTGILLASNERATIKRPGGTVTAVRGSDGRWYEDADPTRPVSDADSRVLDLYVPETGADSSVGSTSMRLDEPSRSTRAGPRPSTVRELVTVSIEPPQSSPSAADEVAPEDLERLFDEVERASLDELARTPSPPEPIASSPDYVQALNQRLATHQASIGSADVALPAVAPEGPLPAVVPEGPLPAFNPEGLPPWLPSELIIASLRRQNTAKADVTATILELDPGRLVINSRDPAGLGRIGYVNRGYAYINSAETLQLSVAWGLSPYDVAGEYAVHEVVHTTQDGQATKANELEAHLAQAEAYPEGVAVRAGINSTETGRAYLDNHPTYRGLPDGDPNWSAKPEGGDVVPEVPEVPGVRGGFRGAAGTATKLGGHVVAGLAAIDTAADVVKDIRGGHYFSAAGKTALTALSFVPKAQGPLLILGVAAGGIADYWGPEHEAREDEAFAVGDAVADGFTKSLGFENYYVHTAIGALAAGAYAGSNAVVHGVEATALGIAHSVVGGATLIGRGGAYVGGAIGDAGSWLWDHL